MLKKSIVKVKNVEFGVGMPKICVSITGKNKTEILTQAEEIKQNPVDVVEWRVDFFEDVLDLESVIDTLKKLASLLEECPILFTFRRKEEGGELEISAKEYKKLNLEVIKSQMISLVDVELFIGDDFVKEIVEVAHNYDVKVVISNHDFAKTPKKEEIICRLQKMQHLGGDLPKIAVMPQNERDVLELLSATEEFYRLYSDRPFITISMSKLGLISRIGGGVFGSAMTFGAVGEVSAPGQMEALKLKKILESL